MKVDTSATAGVLGIVSVEESPSPPYHK